MPVPLSTLAGLRFRGCVREAVLFAFLPNTCCRIAAYGMALTKSCIVMPGCISPLKCTRIDRCISIYNGMTSVARQRRTKPDPPGNDANRETGVNHHRYQTVPRARPVHSPRRNNQLPGRSERHYDSRTWSGSVCCALTSRLWIAAVTERLHGQIGLKLRQASSSILSRVIGPVVSL